MNRCRSCNARRSFVDLTEVNGPSGRFYVCRPDVTDQPCFRNGVMGAGVHTIQATTITTIERPQYPIKPDTAEWADLLRTAGA